jgi:amidohydrolase
MNPILTKLTFVMVLTALVASPRSPATAPEDSLKTRQQAVTQQIDANLEQLAELYKHLHRHPELSYQEAATAGKLAQEMRAIGFEVTTGVGGHGLVCVFRNGPGKTIMVRTDLDGLPVTEKTGLPYASRVVARGRDGLPVGVMHACGHDMHMTCWVGTARVLTALKDHWKGTLVFIGQPAEEVGAGARMMLEAGLFQRFPKPDYALALHCDSQQKAGTVAFTKGLAMANVDTVDVLVKGKGGHGAAPHTTVDPVVLAAKMILDFQTIVSRELDPVEPAVVTVGSIHGGSKHNIIPSEVRLQLTVRSTTDEVRNKILNAIQRIAKGNAEAARAPQPEVSINQSEFTPALINDAKLTDRLTDLFRFVLGKENVLERPLSLGGEDFARYGREGVPIFMYFLGTIDDERWAAAKKPGGEPLPSMHSERFYPVIPPTIRTGVLTMSLAVWDLLGTQDAPR